MFLSQKTPKRGLSLLWGSRTVSLAIHTSLFSYFTYFCTNHLGLNAGIIGAMILVAKIIDAITNFICAYLVDNLHMKLGKGRPFELCIIPAWLCLWLTFGIPIGWKTVVQYAMVFLLYTTIGAVFCTGLFQADPVYFSHAVKDDDKRLKIQTITGALQMGAFMVGTVIFPVLIAKYENEPNGWLKLSVMVGIPCMILGIIRFLTIPEVDVEDNNKKENTHVSIKETFFGLTTNKYAIIVCFMTFTLMLYSAMGGAASYYFTYIVGDLSLNGIVSLASLISIVSLIFVVPAVKKFGQKKTLQICFLISAIATALKFFAGANLPMLIILAPFATLFTYPFGAIQNLLLYDCMDYGEWKNNKRLEGAIVAGTSLGSTIGGGVGSALCGIILDLFGYDGTLAVQSSTSILGIKLVNSLVPALFLLLVVIVLQLYDVEKRMPQIKSDLEKRKNK